MHFIDLPNVQTGVSTHDCMRLRGGRKGKHGPVTSPAQIEVVTRRALVPVARDDGVARRAVAGPFPALFCSTRNQQKKKKDQASASRPSISSTRFATAKTTWVLRGHDTPQHHARVRRMKKHSPTSSHPLCVQLFSMYACRSTPFCEGAARLARDSARSASSGDDPGPGDAPGAALNSSECCTP